MRVIADTIVIVECLVTALMAGIILFLTATGIVALAFRILDWLDDRKRRNMGGEPGPVFKEPNE
jgi:hypothetical protein